MKLETWLRITGIPYELAPFPSHVPPPKGKWPYIDDGGELIADSTLIVEHLRRTRGMDPDRNLSPADRAVGLAFRRMFKENVFWLIIQIRHRDDANFLIYREVLWSLLAPGVPLDEVGEDVKAEANQIRHNMVTQMYGHGMGRHTPRGGVSAQHRRSARHLRLPRRQAVLLRRRAHWHRCHGVRVPVARHRSPAR